MRQRIWELDALRGLFILIMAWVHLVYDLVEFFDVTSFRFFGPFRWLQTWGGVAFVLLSGCCAVLGRHPARRGLQVLGCGALVQVVGVIERVLLVKIYPLEQILVSDAIEKIEYVNVVDFTFVIIFAILMLLSYIFAYGQTLQRESDETL